MGRRARQHGRGGRRGTGAGGGQHGSTFAISSLSQYAGKIAGGTSVTLAGVGFLAPMSCGIGAIAVNSPTSATLTTSSATLAGRVPFTVTNGNLATSAQEYTYWDPPVLVACTPAHGPATLANTARTVTCQNLPPSSSGSPTQLVVGAGTSTSVATTAAATALVDFGAPGQGSLSAHMVVDGVASATVAAFYTGDAPPVVDSMGSTGTGGGIVNAVGTAFAAGMTMTCTPVGGGATTSLSVSVQSSTLAHVTIPAGLSVSRYDVTVQNITDNQTSTTASAFGITTSNTLGTIFGVNDVGEWDFRLAANTGDGTPATSVPAVAGTGGGALSPTGTPIFHHPDPNGHYGGQDSCETNGTSSAFVSGSIPISGNDATLIWAGMVYADPGSAQAAIAAQAPNTTVTQVFYLTGGTGPRLRYGGTPDAGPWPSTQYGIPFIAVGRCHNTGGTANTLSFSVNGQAALTASRTQTPVATSLVVRIGRDFTPNWCRATHAHAALIDRDITAPETVAAVTYLNQLHNVFADPTITAVMPVRASTASTSSRITGTNYPGAGMSVAIIVPGTGVVACTTTAQDTGSIDFTLPASPTLPPGTYAVVLDNGIGNVVTFADKLTATTAITPQTTWGASLVHGSDPNGVTQSGGTVVSVGDTHSLLAQNLTVFGTVAPGWDVTTQARTYNGTSQSVGKAALDLRSTTPGMTILQVIKPTNNTGTTLSGDYGNNVAGIELASGKPRPNTGTAWGVTIGGVEHRVYATWASGATPAQTVNVDEGTAVTGSNGASTLTTGSFFAEAAHWSNTTGSTANSWFNGKIQATFVINRPITLAEAQDFATWYAAQSFPAL